MPMGRRFNHTEGYATLSPACTYTDDDFERGITFSSLKYIGEKDISLPSCNEDVLAAMLMTRWDMKHLKIAKKKRDIFLSTKKLYILRRASKKRKYAIWDHKKNLASKDESTLPLSYVFYVCHDASDSKIFGLIARSDPLSNDKYKCHVFKAKERSEALKIVQAIGQAFEVAYRLNNGNDVDGEDSRNPTKDENRHSDQLPADQAEPNTMENVPVVTDSTNKRVGNSTEVQTNEPLVPTDVPNKTANTVSNAPLISCDEKESELDMLRHLLKERDEEKEETINYIRQLHAELEKERAKSKELMEKLRHTDDTIENIVRLVRTLEVSASNLQTNLLTPAQQTTHTCTNPVYERQTQSWPCNKDVWYKEAEETGFIAESAHGNSNGGNIFQQYPHLSSSNSNIIDPTLVSAFRLAEALRILEAAGKNVGKQEGHPYMTAPTPPPPSPRLPTHQQPSFNFNLPPQQPPYVQGQLTLPLAYQAMQQRQQPSPTASEDAFIKPLAQGTTVTATDSDGRIRVLVSVPSNQDIASSVASPGSRAGSEGRMVPSPRNRMSPSLTLPLNKRRPNRLSTEEMILMALDDSNDDIPNDVPNSLRTTASGLLESIPLDFARRSANGPVITRSTSEKVPNRSELMTQVQRTTWARHTTK